MSTLEDRINGIDARLASIEEQIKNLRSEEDKRDEELRSSEFLSLVTEAEISDPSLAQLPTLTLAARPMEDAAIDRLFSGRNTDVVAHLENPEPLRSNGFGLAGTHTGSKIVRGQYRMALSGRQLRLISRTAQCVSVVRADQEFLAWAMRAEERATQLNPIAIVEYVLEFCRFFQKAFQFANLKKDKAQLLIRFRGFDPSSNPLFLPSHAINTTGFAFGLGTKVEIANPESTLELSWQGGAASVAFKVIKHIYNLCGASDTEIPYVLTADETIDTFHLLKTS